MKRILSYVFISTLIYVGVVSQKENLQVIYEISLDSITALSEDEDFNDYLSDVYRKVEKKTETTTATPDYQWCSTTKTYVIVGYWYKTERNCFGNGLVACYPKTTDLYYESLEKS